MATLPSEISTAMLCYMEIVQPVIVSSKIYSHCLVLVRKPTQPTSDMLLENQLLGRRSEVNIGDEEPYIPRCGDGGTPDK